MSRFNGRIPIRRYRRGQPAWNDFDQDVFQEAPGTAVAPDTVDEEPDPAAPAEPADSATSKAREEAAAAKTKEEDTTTQRLARLREDFTRYRERIARERREDRYRTENDLILELLPVIDNFERGLDAAATDHSSGHVQGFALIHKQLLATIAELGVRPMHTVGESFDPKLHESVMREASSIVPADTIIREVQKGYTRNNAVLRHAQVVISSGSGGEES